MVLKEYKIVVLGSGGVGKTALVFRFVQGKFVDHYDPTIEDSYRKQVTHNGKQVMLEILDTAAMRDLYMKNGQGFLLVYSIVALSTFNEITDIRNQILRVKDEPDVPTVLVGNKLDLEAERDVSTAQGKALAHDFNDCAFFEASAKAQVNVEKIFHTLISLMEGGRPDDGKKKKCILF